MGNFLEVQQLGLWADFTAMAFVQSLVRELRSHKLHGMAKQTTPPPPPHHTKGIQLRLNGENIGEKDTILEILSIL